MPILQGDIKLMASERMADTEDGGGRMTDNEVVDGESNNLFDDVSELDRTYGRVSLRKIYASILTDDVDRYLGGHIIVNKVPDDPDVAVALFTTQDWSDERLDAQDHIERYVVRGPRHHGTLYGMQLEGQMALSWYQRVEAELPQEGDVIDLVGDEGLPTEHEQYVRIKGISHLVREFTVGGSCGTLSRRVVTVEISDPLRYDFEGQDIPTCYEVSPQTVIHHTLVADAARYYGTTNLADAASLNELTFLVDSIFATIVPSSQAENPIVDAVPGGGEQAVYMEAGPELAIVVAGVTDTVFYPRAIMPGSLALIAGGQTFADDAKGNLKASTVIVGTVDYASGAIQHAAGFNATCSITATPAVRLARVADTHIIDITLNNRGNNYVASLRPIPQPGSLSVAYMAQGKWYTLRDNGFGELRGTIDGIGVGTINYATGGTIVTFSALPDADTSVIFTWGTAGEYTERTEDLTIEPFHVDHSLAGPVEPGSLTISWLENSVPKSVTDDGVGNLSGAGTGRVVYPTGEVRVTPANLPDNNTLFDYDYSETTSTSAGVAVSGDTTKTLTLPGTPIRPGSVTIQYTVDPGVEYNEQRSFAEYHFPSGVEVIDRQFDGIITVRVHDDGAGALVGFPGSIVDYATGQVTWIPALDIKNRERQVVQEEDGDKPTWDWGLESETCYLNSSTVTVNVQTDSANSTAKNEQLGSQPMLLDVTPMVVDDVVSGSLMLTIAGDRYVDRDGLLYRQIDGVTNAGLEAGSINLLTGVATIVSWAGNPSNATAGIDSLVTRFASPILGQMMYVTASAPFRPGSFYIRANRASDSVLIDATADASGEFTGPDLFGTADSQTGIVKITFGIRALDSSLTPEQKTEPWYDPNLIDSEGYIVIPTYVKPETIRYNCVAQTYLPLDSEILGLDPVRLPQDGRVPMFRVGDVAVIHRTEATAETTPTTGETIDLGTQRLEWIKITDNDGTALAEGVNYSTDLDAGTLEILATSGKPAPWAIESRYEDMALIMDAQITGYISLGKPLTHSYPGDGLTRVSSALIHGDVFARATNVFAQETWTGDWSDSLIGDAPDADFDDVNYPVLVTNRGSTKERFAFIFTGTTAFRVVGETLGQIAIGDTATECAPINPATGVPYFRVDPLGWGAGWGPGMVLRANMEAANNPIWAARVVQQGETTVSDDKFQIQVRGDVDAD